METDAAKEARARRVASRIANGYYTDQNGRRYGRYRARKSRWRANSMDNLGGFQIVDVWTNNVIAGVRYELSPEAVIAFFEEEE